jgi:hypothetical protein
MVKGGGTHPNLILNSDAIGMNKGNASIVCNA